MNDWENFIETIPWFVDANATVHLSEPREGVELPSTLAAISPRLGQLLGQSHLTPVSINDVPYHLFGWDAADCQRMGWLCLLPQTDVPNNIDPSHAELLHSFGGIIEPLKNLTIHGS